MTRRQEPGPDATAAEWQRFWHECVEENQDENRVSHANTRTSFAEAQISRDAISTVIKRTSKLSWASLAAIVAMTLTVGKFLHDVDAGWISTGNRLGEVERKLTSVESLLNARTPLFADITAHLESLDNKVADLQGTAHQNRKDLRGVVAVVQKRR